MTFGQIIDYVLNTPLAWWVIPLAIVIAVVWAIAENVKPPNPPDKSP